MSDYIKLILIVLIVLIVLYIKKRNEVKKAADAKRIAEQQAAEAKRKAEESVLCEDGVERNLPRWPSLVFPTPIIDRGDPVNWIRDCRRERSKIKSYDLGNSKIKGVAAFGKGEFPQKLSLHSLVCREKWFSQKGKFLNSSEILRAAPEGISRRGPAFGPSATTATIYIINEIYFIFYWDRLPDFQLFEGKLNGVQYKNGIKKES